MSRSGWCLMIAIALIGGIYTITSLNSVSDVIAEENRKSKAERLEAKKLTAEHEKEEWSAEGQHSYEGDAGWADDTPE